MQQINSPLIMAHLRLTRHTYVDTIWMRWKMNASHIILVSLPSLSKIINVDENLMKFS